MSEAVHPGGAFLDLPPEMSDPRTSPVLVLPVPYEATTCYVKGTAWGPAAIIEASAHVEWYDESAGDEPCSNGIHTLAAVDCSGTPETVLDRIRTEVARHVSAGRFVLSLGGEHTVTVGCADGAASSGDLTVVQIDAHADLRDEYQGSRFSHACVMRRLVDRHPIVQIGIRALSSEEARFAEGSNRVYCVSGDYIAAARLEGGGRGGWIRGALNAVRTDRVYLSVDLDGLDPSVVPAVGTPVPGGLLWYEMLAFVEELFASRSVVSADVVELCPIPGQIASEFAAAQLAYKIAGHALRAARRPGA
ncbi:MAG: agmatinase [Candidatus Eisenbacteria bacterium]